MFESSKYKDLRVTHGRVIAQTLDSPVMILDFWELGDLYMTLVTIFIFGVIMAQWLLTLIALGVLLFVFPMIRKKTERGFFYHFPYKYLGLCLKKLPNPQRRSRYSD